MRKRVRIHTSCDVATVPYVRHMWDVARRLAASPDDLAMTVHCIDKATDPSPVLSFQGAEGVTALRTVGFGPHPQGSSHFHGLCVKEALSLSADGDVHLIVDSDAFVVLAGWDDLVRRWMAPDGVGIVGTVYEDAGGPSSGGRALQTYKGKPTLTWCALNPRHDWRSFDTSPNKGTHVDVRSEADAELWGLPVGGSVFCDVGWRLPVFLRDGGISYAVLRRFTGTRGAVVLKDLRDYHEEYHAEADGRWVPFLVHHRGSLRHPFRGSDMSVAFFDRLDGWVDAQLRSRAEHEQQDLVVVPAVPEQ